MRANLAHTHALYLLFECLIGLAGTYTYVGGDDPTELMAIIEMLTAELVT